MNQWTEEYIKDVVNKVVDRAKSDEGFRHLLVSSPHRAIYEATGAVVPDGVRLQFVDQNAADMTIVLPPLKTEEDELTSNELEAIAGGKASAGEVLNILSTIGTVLGGAGAIAALR